MPVIKIDGREIPFNDGETIIRAATRVGIEIPHYCWHPGLSVAANCRMCLVEVESQRPMMLDVLRWDEAKQAYVPDRKPKLVPACEVRCADGMVIKSDSSPHVLDARKHVQEFLLLNHPVDCPICDQAGECKLQDYWLSAQRTPKRMHDEPIHKPKAVTFGATIVYDAERCIVCTRCVRFMKEVAQDPVLAVRERGNLNEIMVAPGRELDGKYTMMVDHVCPVGALTTRDFRFKARVWFLRKAPTICPGCATGCNAWLDYDPRTGNVPRLRPRDNEQVNKYWMCDDGILTHQRVGMGRVLHAYVGRGKTRAKTTMNGAIAEAAKILRAAKNVAVVLSAQRSTEDNFAIAHFARTFLGTQTFYLARLADWEGDAILRDADHNPNVRGAMLAAGGTVDDMDALVEPAVSGLVDAILTIGGYADIDPVVIGALGRAKIVVAAANVGSLTEIADVLLPASSWAEQEGSFVNRQGLDQRFEAGPKPAGDSAPVWEVIARIARAMGHSLEWKKLREVRAAMKALATPAPAPSPAE